jgi:hypothetical protein
MDRRYNNSLLIRCRDSSAVYKKHLPDILQTTVYDPAMTSIDPMHTEALDRPEQGGIIHWRTRVKGDQMVIPMICCVMGVNLQVCCQSLVNYLRCFNSRSVQGFDSESVYVYMKSEDAIYPSSAKWELNSRVFQAVWSVEWSIQADGLGKLAVKAHYTRLYARGSESGHHI